MLAALLPYRAAAQQPVPIEGRVFNQQGQPLSGAVVQVSGLSLVATAGEDGSYRMQGPGSQARGQTARLVARMIGYRMQSFTISLTGGAMIQHDFTLVSDALRLDEVVVTGTAGDQSRRSQAATVNSIRIGDSLLQIIPQVSVPGLLQSRIPGVSVLAASGTSGTSSQIRVRGPASISLSNEPLLYIDGVRVLSGANFGFFTGGQAAERLHDIPPEDIEDIQLVKGPAAATLYGADASAGVINIITRRGRAGPQSFRQSVGFEYNSIEANFTPRTNYARCSAGDVADTLDALCGPNNVTTPGTARAVGDLVSDNPLMRESAIRQGSTYGINWSGRGGGQNYGVYTSFGKETEEGVFANNAFARTNGRVNFNWTATPTLSIDVGVGVTRSTFELPDNDNNIFGWLGNSHLGLPTTRTLNASGNNGWFGFQRDVAAMSAIERSRRTNRGIGTVTANWTPRSWFTHRVVAGYDWAREEDRVFFPKNTRGSYSVNVGQISELRRGLERYTLDYLGNLERNLQSNLVSNLSFGVQLVDTRNENVSATGEGLTVNSNNTVGGASTRSGGQGFSLERSVGFIGQWQLGYHNRLHAQVGLRVDNASSFGTESKWVYLPKVGASWVVSEEPFWRLGVVNALRLRAAWGTTGRIPGAGASLQTLSSAPFLDGSIQPGAVPANPGNAGLRFERGTEFEGGLDAAFLNDRIGVELTYFNKVSRDLILAKPLPPSSGFTQFPFVNIGAMVNRGWELAVRAIPVNRRNFSWDVRLGLNTLHNEVTDMGSGADSIAPFGTLNRVEEGMQLGAWITNRIRSIDTTTGVVVVDSIASFYGNVLPTLEANLSSNISVMRNLRIYASIDTKRGHLVRNFTDFFRETQLVRSNLRLDTTLLSRTERLRRYGNQTTGQPAFITERCAATGPTYPCPANTTRTVNDVQEAYIQPGDFVRLREVSVTYSLPRSIARYVRAASASVTVGGQNLALWTDYEGYDPEVASNATAQFNRDDFFTQPPVRRFITRVSLTY
jgi:TonB-linked SusC/RagA family outer membrane protein